MRSYAAKVLDSEVYCAHSSSPARVSVEIQARAPAVLLNLGSFGEDGEVAVVGEQPVAGPACQLARDALLDEDLHRRGSGWERKLGMFTHLRQR